MTKLWEKEITLNEYVERFTVKNDHILDLKLLPYDCIASKAHAKMLYKIGILTKSELIDIERGLDQIIKDHESGKFKIDISQEDCHTAIEDYLVKNIGVAGEKIHTGRSRNDQVLTALRLFYKNEILSIKDKCEVLIKSFYEFGQKYKSIEFPGYTHMQKAMPSSVLLWSEAYIECIKEDIKYLDFIYLIIDQSPSGSGAGFGVPLEIDREQVSKYLEFSKVQENPIHCQLSRGKYEIKIIQSLTAISYTLNKIASDIILFSMAELGYFILPKEFCTGSSIMPQKNNPDVIELIRGSYHLMIGYDSQVKTLSANLISGYNRDIQLTKEPIFNALRLIDDSLKIGAVIIDGLGIDKKKCKGAMTDDIYATKKVYDLVKKGVPFREAYRNIAKTIK